VFLPDGELEGKEIYLAQCLLVDDDAAVEPMRLRVVADEVLDGRRDARALHSAHVRAGDLAREQRVLGVVLEVAPAERGANHVRGRGEQDVHAIRARRLAEKGADRLDQVGIPRRRERRAAGNQRAAQRE
jgi:hypothetical protein